MYRWFCVYCDRPVTGGGLLTYRYRGFNYTIRIPCCVRCFNVAAHHQHEHLDVGIA